MSKQLPFDTLIQLATTEVDEAARRLGALQQDRAGLEQQLKGLVTYRTEYENRLTEASKAGIGGANWRNFQQFIATLSEAIGQQQAGIDAMAGKIDLATREWQIKKQKLNSFQTLDNRATQRENVRLGRIEQRESDEHAAKLIRMRAHSAQD
jgi:flagellar FliJ protein